MILNTYIQVSLERENLLLNTFVLYFPEIGMLRESLTISHMLLSRIFPEEIFIFPVSNAYI